MGELTKNDYFRGNLLYASSYHIEYLRARKIDDVFSLLCVAYHIMNQDLPWLSLIDKFARMRQHKDFDCIKEFTDARIGMHREHAK